jgi:DNA-binding PadR family transcriptional regulator
VFVNRRPKTWFQITPDGRRALERLFRQLEEMLAQSK